MEKKKTLKEPIFESLEAINTRPAPFSSYTADELWTDAHTAENMLSFHLDPEADIASRNAAFVRRSVDWIASRFDIGKETRIIDFGCGPGLYAMNLARRQGRVTGIDFSGRSIDHAKRAAADAGVNVRYVQQNYLAFETGDRFDLAMMIMCDFCALSPAQRKRMLEKIRTMLLPGGAVLLDVYSLNAFDSRTEAAVYHKNLLDGFWSPEKYYGFVNTFKYDEEKVILDKYTIIEATRIRTIFNWLQYFSPEALEKEFEACGLAVESRYRDVAGAPYDPTADEFAVIGVKS